MSSARTKRRRIQRDVEETLAQISNQYHNNEDVTDCSLNEVSDASSDIIQFNCMNRDFNLIEDSNSISSETEQKECITNVANRLGKWAVNNNITNVAVDELLGILNPHIPGIPKNSRTLLGTPTRYIISNICGGQYFYFGLKRYIQELKTTDFIENFKFNILRISLGVDGVPISKSSKRQFWPILVIFEDTVKRCPYLVALYFGTAKPNSVHDFIQPLVNEFNEINSTGIIINAGKLFLEVRCVIADAPARSFLKCTVPYNAYFGCERCCDKGKYLGRVIFPNFSAQKRTNETFKNQDEARHHVAVSPLLRMNVGLVSDVVLDYMHLVCLGVMRKLLQCWYKGPLPHKLDQRSLKIISARLLKIRKFIPLEFNRKPRSIFDLDNWKATELRTFLLYLGPVVLHSILNKNKYDHFLKFSIAIRILVSGNKAWYEIARQLLVEFVKEMGTLYSREFYVYNVHSLIHLVDDAERFGGLDSISAFKFENYMQSLKKMVRSHKNELSQVIRRVHEQQQILLAEPKTGDISKLSQVIKKFKKVGNDCFLLKSGEIIRILKIDNGKITCEKFTEKSSIYSSPIPSEKIGIFRVNSLNIRNFECVLSDILRKVMLLPYNIENPGLDFICLPLCNVDV